MSTYPHRFRHGGPDEPPDLRILLILVFTWALYVTWLVIALRLLHPDHPTIELFAVPERNLLA